MKKIPVILQYFFQESIFTTFSLVYTLWEGQSISIILLLSSFKKQKNRQMSGSRFLKGSILKFMLVLNYLIDLLVPIQKIPSVLTE